jgi:hypothetical protein
LQKLVGHDNLQNVALVTNKWIKNPDPEEAKRQIERYQELQEIYWADMIDAGSLVMEHSGTRASAHLIVSTLLLKNDILLNALREIVTEEKEWEDTQAGRAANEKPGSWSNLLAWKHAEETKSKEGPTNEPSNDPPSKSKKGSELQEKDKATRKKGATSTQRGNIARGRQEKGTAYKIVPKPKQPLPRKTAPKKEPEKSKLELVKRLLNGWIEENPDEFLACLVAGSLSLVWILNLWSPLYHVAAFSLLLVLVSRVFLYILGHGEPDKP